MKKGNQAREVSFIREKSKKIPIESEKGLVTDKKQVSDPKVQSQNRATPNNAWDSVQLSRHQERPYTRDYIERLLDSFWEIHGDRKYADDRAIVGGMGLLKGSPVLVLGHQKGRNIKQRLEHNYGMPKPEGYRKALRLMKLAEKFKRPILTFIDTPGAYPGLGAEERGQAEAIAYNLRSMAVLQVPIIVTVLGEGGSGGALAIGLGDRILMLENSIYSVISPESCSAILWKDQNHVREAAQSLKLTAQDMKRFGIADEIIPEPPGGAHTDWNQMASQLSEVLSRHLEEISNQNPDDRIAQRYQKFRNIGEYIGSPNLV